MATARAAENANVSGEMATNLEKQTNVIFTKIYAVSNKVVRTPKMVNAVLVKW